MLPHGGDSTDVTDTDTEIYYLSYQIVGSVYIVAILWLKSEA